ncbi:MAG: hypothetical protein WCO57_16980 [Verrucomicrobiota bacterium]
MKRKIRKQIDAYAHNPSERQADHKTRKLMKLLDSIRPADTNRDQELKD